MGNEREEFFKFVDSAPCHPLVGWAKDEIIRLEAIVGVKDHKIDLAKARHTADKEKLSDMSDEVNVLEKEARAKKKADK